jgi:cysteinyl-tRNA synthetase
MVNHHLNLYNTLSRRVETFKPFKDDVVSLYACGMTVYDNAHIGHAKKYIGDDILVRVLQWNGYNVTHAMNVTDVGHLTNDSDDGEDKMLKGAEKYNMSVWEVAQRFEGEFWKSMDAVGNTRPHILMHATDYIDEQIALIQQLEQKGYTYRIQDGIYFDTSKFPSYFALSRQDPSKLQKGARVAFEKGKRHVSDFALWKFSYPDGRPFDKTIDDEHARRQMEWESPWGVGFPGWHIECSAMSMDAFGPQIDIHTGGIDHINIHHTNEIAQSEAVTGEQFVKYWVHHNHLFVDGQKMSKSLGNVYTVQDVMDRGFDPLVLRYLFLTGHYRQEMNFTWESLEAAQIAYDRLVKEFKSWDKTGLPSKEHLEKFTEALNDDLNTAKAIAVMWELVKAPIASGIKAATLQDMDGVLGLGIMEKELAPEAPDIPDAVTTLLTEREAFRAAKDWAASDEVRRKIEDLGYIVEDSPTGATVQKK